jgi:hypothetical protein
LFNFIDPSRWLTLALEAEPASKDAECAYEHVQTKRYDICLSRLQDLTDLQISEETASIPSAAHGIS